VQCYNLYQFAAHARNSPALCVIITYAACVCYHHTVCCICQSYCIVCTPTSVDARCMRMNIIVVSLLFLLPHRPCGFRSTKIVFAWRCQHQAHAHNIGIRTRACGKEEEMMGPNGKSRMSPGITATSHPTAASVVGVFLIVIGRTVKVSIVIRRQRPMSGSFQYPTSLLR
jgi:hypothetical protein